MTENDLVPAPAELKDHSFEISTKSNVVKSTRRIMFISSNDSDPLEFKGDHFGGKGSGVLIKIGEKYFYLTAKHVITSAFGKSFKLGDEFPSYSPFWITTKTIDRTYKELEQFMFPSKIWDISDQINSEVNATDTTDICLIEMRLGNPHYLPDHCIEINSKEDVSTIDQFWGGKFLFIVGYPGINNNYKYEDIEDGFTHSTDFRRSVHIGVYHDDMAYIDHNELDQELTHEMVSGMSGGAVLGMYPTIEEIKLSGILVSSSGGISRFIPSYVFIDALLNYNKSKSYIVDPATVPREELSDNPEMLAYADEAYDKFMVQMLELRKGPFYKN